MLHSCLLDLLDLRLLTPRDHSRRGRSLAQTGFSASPAAKAARSSSDSATSRLDLDVVRGVPLGPAPLVAASEGDPLAAEYQSKLFSMMY